MSTPVSKSVWKGKFRGAPKIKKDEKKPKKRTGLSKRGGKRRGKKTPKPAGGDDLEGDDVAAPVERGPPSEAAKEKIARLKSRSRQLSAAEFEASKALAAEISTRTSKEQADWLFSSFQRHSQATALERDGLTADCLTHLPSKAQGSLEQGLKALEGSQWQHTLCNTSSCDEISTLFISPAALGCTSLIKSCSDLNRRCKIAKLFAKHFKWQEQAEMLRSTPACIGAGTPSRLCKLAEEKALQLDKLKWIVVDCRLDMKQRTLLDMPEIAADWWSLWEGYLKAAVVERGAKIILSSSSSDDDDNYM